MIRRHVPKTLQGPIARATVRTSFVLGGRLLVQTGTLLLVARMLGPQQFGAFAGAAALAVILGTLSTFGTHLMLLGEVSKNPARRESVLRFALPTTLLCGGILLAIYLGVCLLFLRETDVAFRVLLALGIAETILQPLISMCTAEHHGLGRIARAQLLTLLPLTMRMMAAAAIFTLGPADQLGIYAYGYGIASLLALVLISSENRGQTTVYPGKTGNRGQTTVYSPPHSRSAPRLRKTGDGPRFILHRPSDHVDLYADAQTGRAMRVGPGKQGTRETRDRPRFSLPVSGNKGQTTVFSPSLISVWPIRHMRGQIGDRPRFSLPV